MAHMRRKRAQQFCGSDAVGRAQKPQKRKGTAGCDALASLILVSGESGAATKFAGYALYSLMQEHRDFVVDAIETHCKNEPAWGRVLLLALHLTSPDVCTLCR